MTEAKQRIFSGIQPSGNITIGNYIGALKNWVALQDQYECLYCVVDLHAITVQQVPAELRRHTLDLLSLYLACGIDPEKCTLFVQSHVPAHAELCWALDTIASVGEMSRMTQFKDKSRKHADNVNMGLMNYPVLMAADILLYQTALVPIGIDQKQHLELARNLAGRFNSRYGETFVIPEPFIPKAGAKIMSLQDPTAKMSKSDENPNGPVLMTDDADTVTRKFKRAVTDSVGEIRLSEDQPGVANLLTIYGAFAGCLPEEAAERFAGKGYGDLKSATAEAVNEALRPIQAEQKRIAADKEYLNGILKRGAEKAASLAARTLRKVYRKIGFYQIQE